MKDSSHISEYDASCVLYYNPGVSQTTTRRRIYILLSRPVHPCEFYKGFVVMGLGHWQGVLLAVNNSTVQPGSTPECSASGVSKERYTQHRKEEWEVLTDSESRPEEPPPTPTTGPGLNCPPGGARLRLGPRSLRTSNLSASDATEPIISHPQPWMLLLFTHFPYLVPHLR
jgi:hypothetical protein